MYNFLDDPVVIEGFKNNNLDVLYLKIQEEYGNDLAAYKWVSENYLTVTEDVNYKLKEAGIDILKYIKHLDCGLLSINTNTVYDLSKYTNITHINDGGFSETYYSGSTIILPKSIIYINAYAFDSCSINTLKFYTDSLKHIGRHALNLDSGDLVVDDQKFGKFDDKLQEYLKSKGVKLH